MYPLSASYLKPVRRSYTDGIKTELPEVKPPPSEEHIKSRIPYSSRRYAEGEGQEYIDMVQAERSGVRTDGEDLGITPARKGGIFDFLCDMRGIDPASYSSNDREDPYELLQKLNAIDIDALCDTEVELKIDYSKLKRQFSESIPLRSNTRVLSSENRDLANSLPDQIFAGTFLLGGAEIKLEEGDTLQDICDKITASSENTIAELSPAVMDGDYSIILLYYNGPRRASWSADIVDRGNCLNSCFGTAVKSKDLSADATLNPRAIFEHDDYSDLDLSLEDFVTSINEAGKDDQFSDKAYLVDGSSEGTKSIIIVSSFKEEVKRAPKDSALFQYKSSILTYSCLDSSLIASAKFSMNGGEAEAEGIVKEVKFDYKPFGNFYLDVGSTLTVKTPDGAPAFSFKYTPTRHKDKKVFPTYFTSTFGLNKEDIRRIVSEGLDSHRAKLEPRIIELNKREGDRIDEERRERIKSLDAQLKKIREEIEEETQKELDKINRMMEKIERQQEQLDVKADMFREMILGESK